MCVRRSKSRIVPISCTMASFFAAEHRPPWPLPMSTLELAELLNQEMVENPLLEEVPSEDAQTPETTQTQETPEAAKADNGKDTWDDADYEYFFGEYLDEGY